MMSSKIVDTREHWPSDPSWKSSTSIPFSGWNIILAESFGKTNFRRYSLCVRVSNQTRTILIDQAICHLSWEFEIIVNRASSSAQLRHTLRVRHWLPHKLIAPDGWLQEETSKIIFFFLLFCRRSENYIFLPSSLSPPNWRNWKRVANVSAMFDDELIIIFSDLKRRKVS